MIAANLAGKAINISQTTAAHAMSYKLTSLYHIPHGQAVAICLPQVWEYLVNNYKFQSNTELLNDILRRLNKLFKADNSVDAMLSYKKLLKQFDMYPKIDLSNDVEKLAKSVNTTRLKNYPATLSEDDLIKMYNDLSNGR
jgi:alcohol dehydrogenase class IV